MVKSQRFIPQLVGIVDASSGARWLGNRGCAGLIFSNTWSVALVSFFYNQNDGLSDEASGRQLLKFYDRVKRIFLGKSFARSI